MNINGINAAAAPSAVEPLAQAAGAAAPAQAAMTGDVVEISTAARLAAMAQELPDVRADLVAEIKAQIAAGTYETADKIDLAVERLLDELL